MEILSLAQIREQKLSAIRETENPYPERYPITHELSMVPSLADGSRPVRVAGRILSIRKMGKLTFITLADILGKAQIAVKKDAVGEERYDFFHRHIDIGDFLGAEGEVFTTHTGEKTIRADAFAFLGKACLPLPEKYHGLNDMDACYRQRYLDLIMNEDTRRRFLLKSNLVKAIRRHLEDHGYMEIETPVLINKPSGALARPFVSHHNALDIDVYLRIAPETYLKRAIVGGYTKVFEFARCFRNEGMDASHLQDFTLLEGYCAYYSYKDNMAFLKKMLCSVVSAVFGGTQLTLEGRQIDLDGEWPVVTFRELLLADCGIDIGQTETAEELLEQIQCKGIGLESKTELSKLGKGNLIDLLYKKVSRPHILQPTFLTEHPISLSPLARAKDDNPQVADRFQLIINGAEVINAYSELVDPAEQFKRLSDQARLNAGGDDEAMQMDKDYVAAMRYGMPPISGWGMGIDRFVQVLTGQSNLRDSVLFPIMRPAD